jgi:hypothetical protein
MRANQLGKYLRHLSFEPAFTRPTLLLQTHFAASSECRKPVHAGALPPVGSAHPDRREIALRDGFRIRLKPRQRMGDPYQLSGEAAPRSGRSSWPQPFDARRKRSCSEVFCECLSTPPRPRPVEFV